MKTATVFSALHKSRRLSSIALDRASDYMDLLKVELKIREQDIVLKIAGFAVAGVFGLLAIVFLGLAIIVSFWESDYRGLAAWFVVLLYGGIAAFTLRYCMTHFKSPPLSQSLRDELRRDMDVIKENI